jgi:hypothetical protein
MYLLKQSLNKEWSAVMTENLIVAAVLVGAGLLAVRYVYRIVTGAEKGCAGCPSRDCHAAAECGDCSESGKNHE